MQINGLNSAGASWPVSSNRPGGQPVAPVADQSAHFAPQDEVEISSVGKLLDQASRTPSLREQRLAEIKSAIEAGTYDTPDKLELAITRMLDRFASEVDSR